MVAVPRHDFLHRIEANFVRTAGLSVVAALAVVLVGLAVLAVVTRELRRVVEAARLLGNGQASPHMRLDRRDELGELARSFADMQTRLTTDHLTGLSNREAMLRHNEERILQQRRRSDSRPFAVMFADFDGFKLINDRYGHDVGDAVLREQAQRLRAGLRAHDLVARYAGDEFLILLDAAEKPQDAEAVRLQLELSLRQPLTALATRGATEPGVSASFGVAMYPQDGLDVSTLVKHADEDMYRRKRGQ